MGTCFIQVITKSQSLFTWETMLQQRQPSTWNLPKRFLSVSLVKWVNSLLDPNFSNSWILATPPLKNFDIEHANLSRWLWFSTPCLVFTRNSVFESSSIYNTFKTLFNLGKGNSYNSFSQCIFNPFLRWNLVDIFWINDSFSFIYRGKNKCSLVQKLTTRFKL